MDEYKGKASTRAKNKYNAANYERISLVVQKGEKDKIREYAEGKNESVNHFLKRSIDVARFFDKISEMEYFHYSDGENEGYCLLTVVDNMVIATDGLVRNCKSLTNMGTTIIRDVCDKKKIPFEKVIWIQSNTRELLKGGEEKYFIINPNCGNACPYRKEISLSDLKSLDTVNGRRDIQEKYFSRTESKN